MAAPAKDGDNFVLDMATTSVALGKVNVFCKVYFYINKRRYWSFWYNLNLFPLSR